ncbi:MAG TPA: hypothetical protein VF796_04510, partial [Humisphaera sp.]
MPPTAPLRAPRPLAARRGATLALLAVGVVLAVGLWFGRDRAEPAVNVWLGPARWAFVALAAAGGAAAAW